MSISQRKRELTKLIHKSHNMSKWESTIVTLIATARFGEIRSCKKCDAEQAITAAGREREQWSGLSLKWARYTFAAVGLSTTPAP